MPETGRVIKPRGIFVESVPLVPSFSDTATYFQVGIALLLSQIITLFMRNEKIIRKFNSVQQVDGRPCICPQFAVVAILKTSRRYFRASTRYSHLVEKTTNVLRYIFQYGGDITHSHNLNINIMCMFNPRVNHS